MSNDPYMQSYIYEDTSDAENAIIKAMKQAKDRKHNEAVKRTYEIGYAAAKYLGRLMKTERLRHTQAMNTCLQDHHNIIDGLLGERDRTNDVIAAYEEKIEQLRKENQTLASERSTSEEYASLGTCIVCVDRGRSTRFHPCGHTVCCQPCARRIRDTNQTCPVCNRHLLALNRVFV